MKTERFEMRVAEDFLAAVDEWRRKQPDLPPRAEAVRRLLERALALEEPAGGVESNRAGIRDLLTAWFTKDPARIQFVYDDQNISVTDAVNSFFKSGKRSASSDLATPAREWLDIFEDHHDEIATQIRAMVEPLTR